jgi:hypothetical protein
LTVQLPDRCGQSSGRQNLRIRSRITVVVLPLTNQEGSERETATFSKINSNEDVALAGAGEVAREI